MRRARAAAPGPPGGPPPPPPPPRGGGGGGGSGAGPPVRPPKSPPPRLWKLPGYGKLRATAHPPPDLPTPLGNPGRPPSTPRIPTATHSRDDEVN
jgi:hypothetical protein